MSAIKIPDLSASVPPDGFLIQQKITINSSTLMSLPLPPSCCDQPKTGNIFIMISIVSFISFNILKREA